MATPAQKTAVKVATAKGSNQNILLSSIQDLVKQSGLLYTTGFEDFLQPAGSSVGLPDATGGLPVTQQQIENASTDMLDAVTQEYGLFDKDGKRYNVDRYVAAFYGPPEDVNTRLLHPAFSSEFLHAKPSQLSLLQPLLKFFMVNRDGEEQEIYFSDHMTEKRSLELASLRRAGTQSEVLSPKSDKGSNVGIKSFTWDYHNKHEGDRIIRANLELYFGSLGELVNENYLQFLFTNGRTSVMFPNLGPNGSRDTLDDRRQALFVELDHLQNLMESAKTKGKQILYLPINGGSDSLLDKNDFLQLKVAVGWNVPKGSQQKLLRLFSGDADTKRTKLNDFLESVNRTQRVITLGLVDYEVNFSQEGPTTLSIKYMGSADSYLASVHSDIFGQYNQELPLNQKTVYMDLSALGHTQLIKQIESDALKIGYVYHNFITQGQYQKDGKTITTGEPSYMGLMLERKYLQVALQSATLNKTGSAASIKISAQLAVVDSVIDLYLKVTEPERLATMMASLVRNQQIFRAVYRDGKKVEVKRGAEIYDSDWKAKIKRLFEKWSKSKEAPNLGDLYSPPQEGERHIFYLRLGDLLKTASVLAELRDDVKFVLGTMDPTSLGLPNNGDYISIYDIPISLEYYMQFFYEKFVGQGRPSYPMRSFVDDLQTLVGSLVNQLSDYTVQTSFGMTVYSSYNFIQEKVLVPQTITRYQQRNNNIVYKKKQGGKIFHHYVFFANQIKPDERYGDKKKDEENGIYHYVLGSDRGLAREFNFTKIDMPQYKALQIEAANYGVSKLERTVASSRALILPQNIEIVMFGNNLHQNGDYIYVDSRVALGDYANKVLSIGGYYKVVRSSHSIKPGEFRTVLTCLYAMPTGEKP